MTPLNCLVVDDEPIARGIVEDYIGRVPMLTHVASCKNAFEALESVKKLSIDVIFLDINMPGLSGIGLLKTMPNRPSVILTTAYPEFALEGFELSVTDYLLKPFSFERFFQAVLKVQNKHPLVESVSDEPSTDSIFVKTDHKLIRLLLEEICMVEAYGNYVKIHTDTVILSPTTLSEFHNKLSKKNFLRIHKSFVINRHKIKSLEGNMVVLDNGKEAPVSRLYKKDLLKQLGL